MAASAMLRIEVCAASAQRVLRVRLTLAQGATVADALGRALAQLPPAEAAELAGLAAGVHGRRRPPEWVLLDGDRVELYRPLRADPNQTRLRRAGLRPQRAPG